MCKKNVPGVGRIVTVIHLNANDRSSIGLYIQTVSKILTECINEIAKVEIILGMKKDPRYKGVRRLLLNNDLVELKDIVKFIPKTVVARDLGIDKQRFTQKLEHVEKMRLEELFRLAALLNVDNMELIKLVAKQQKLPREKS
jgi:hypothetical protein